MPIAEHESHQIAVYAGQGETTKLASAVKDLARREGTSTAEILIGCKDDFHQNAAHIAAKAAQTRNEAMAVDTILVIIMLIRPAGSIETLAELLGSGGNKAIYFNMANRFSGDRPVHTAMRHGHMGVLKVLVANGADPTVKNRFGDMIVDYLGDFEPEEVHKLVDEYNSKITRERCNGHELVNNKA
jgi:hypothetical protein